MLHKIDKSDLVAGLVIAGVGLFFFAGAFEYGIGTTRRMGPGYLPMAVGAITIFLGIVIAINALRQASALPRPDIRATLAVLAAIAVFGASLERFGLAPAVALAVVISSLGDRDVRAIPTMILAVAVALGIWLVFSVILGLPFHAFRMPA